MTLLVTQASDFGLPVAIIFAVLFVFFFIVLVKRYKRCPSDRILVVYGNVGSGQWQNVFTVVQPLLFQ